MCKIKINTMKLNNLIEFIEVINILAIIISPIIATIISITIMRKVERRKDKMEVFKQLMIYRAIPDNIEYVKILNSIDVIFSDSKKVRKAWDELHDTYKMLDDNIDRVKQKRLNLIKAVAGDLGYKNKEWEYIIANEYIPLQIFKKEEQKEKEKEKAEN